MAVQNSEHLSLDIELLSEILREFIPYRLMNAVDTGRVHEVLADALPHHSWTFDAWVIANAYRILSSHDDATAIERELLQLLYPDGQDENGQLARE